MLEGCFIDWINFELFGFEFEGVLIVLLIIVVFLLLNILGLGGFDDFLILVLVICKVCSRFLFFLIIILLFLFDFDCFFRGRKEGEKFLFLFVFFLCLFDFWCDIWLISIYLFWWNKIKCKYIYKDKIIIRLLFLLFCYILLFEWGLGIS